MTEGTVQNVMELRDLSFQVGKQYLAYHVNWKIQRGSHWLVYGMNGCGKTTLLSILAGFRCQTEGEYRLFGETLNSDNVLEARKKVGWISSSFFDVHYHNERVLDIVLSGKSGTYGVNEYMNPADYRRAMELLAAWNLKGKEYRGYHQLSKGQRQNVLIARALFQEPEVLLLDEPCSGLDVLAKFRFMEFLKEWMRDESKTVLFVSHEAEQVKDLFDNTIMLRNGRVFRQGKTEELFCKEVLSGFLQQDVELMDEKELHIVPSCSI